MKLKLINTPELFNEVIKLGKEDGHELIVPNLAVIQGKDIIGAVSQMHCSLVWMDTKKAQVRHSVQLKETLESLTSANGGKVLCLPCSVKSPYYNLLPKDGFLNLGSFDLFVKGV